MISEKEHYYSEIDYGDQPIESRSVEVLPKVDRPYANVTDDTQHASQTTERGQRRSSDLKDSKRCSKTLVAVVITVLSCSCIGLLIGIIILASKECAEKGRSKPKSSFLPKS